MDDLVAYAVGEVSSPFVDKSDEELLENDRWYPTTWNTYEVVTAWVHPRSVQSHNTQLLQEIATHNNDNIMAMQISFI